MPAVCPREEGPQEQSSLTLVATPTEPRSHTPTHDSNKWWLTTSDPLLERNIPRRGRSCRVPTHCKRKKEATLPQQSLVRVAWVWLPGPYVAAHVRNMAAAKMAAMFQAGFGTRATQSFRGSFCGHCLEVVTTRRVTLMLQMAVQDFHDAWHALIFKNCSSNF